MTRTLLSRSKGQRSRSSDRFAHRRVGASGGCSGWRGNVFAVGNCCYVVVCSAAQGASAPTGGEGWGISWRPPSYSLLTLISPESVLGLHLNSMSMKLMCPVPLPSMSVYHCHNAQMMDLIQGTFQYCSDLCVLLDFMSPMFCFVFQSKFIFYLGLVCGRTCT